MWKFDRKTEGVMQWTWRCLQSLELLKRNYQSCCCNQSSSKLHKISFPICYHKSWFVTQPIGFFTITANLTTVLCGSEDLWELDQWSVKSINYTHDSKVEVDLLRRNLPPGFLQLCVHAQEMEKGYWTCTKTFNWWLFVCLLENIFGVYIWVNSSPGNDASFTALESRSRELEFYRHEQCPTIYILQMFYNVHFCVVSGSPTKTHHMADGEKFACMTV